MSGPIILVIDDSSFQRMMLKQALKGQNYTFIEAVNGREGLEKVFDLKPDCIVTDLLMPEVNGQGVIRAVREAGLDTPIVVVTANIQVKAHIQCMKLGATYLINKPVKKADFRNKIALLLKSRIAA